MTFAIPAAAYDRFIGRYSQQLAPLFADFAGIGAGMRVLDVGCGPGALTAELVRRVGAAKVTGIDPSSSFVDACRARLPATEIRQAAAEQLPCGDAEFDAALSQLVVGFVEHAELMAGEMRVPQCRRDSTSVRPPHASIFAASLRRRNWLNVDCVPWHS